MYERCDANEARSPVFLAISGYAGAGDKSLVDQLRKGTPQMWNDEAGGASHSNLLCESESSSVGILAPRGEEVARRCKLEVRAETRIRSYMKSRWRRQCPS